MEEEDGIKLLLSSCRVLDLTDAKGYFCSKILGDLGAEVTRLEKPGLRKDYWWWAYNYKKSVVNLDIEKEKGRVVQLAKEADFLIESFSPGYLDSLGLGYASLKQINPGLIFVSITPFGQAGPYRDYKASDLELMALAGVIYEMGDPDRPPVRISFPQTYLVTSAEAAFGAVWAHYYREVYGEGQFVDVSAQASALGVLQGLTNRYRYAGVKQQQMGGNHGPMQGIGIGNAKGKYFHPFNPIIWPCKDGCIAFLMHGGPRGAPNHNKMIKYFETDGDLPDPVRNIKWEEFDFYQTSPEDMEQVWGTFGRFFKRHTRHELFQIALKENIELFPTNTVKDVLADEQLEDRRFWQAEEIPDLGKGFRLPGPFAKVRFGATPSVVENNHPNRSPQPLLFDGLKVLAFTWVYTGPWVAQWLSINGAEVVKIENRDHLDASRRNATQHGFAGWHSSQKGMTIDLKHPEGKDLVYKLAKRADVVIENMSPGALQRLGFGYDELVKLNPSIIVLSASMFGADGRHASQRGLGFQLTSLAGFNDLTGWPDRNPVLSQGAYTDVLAGRTTAATLFAALGYRRRTGVGCHIDVSQYEASMHFLAPLILESQDNGHLMTRMGNRSLTDCPHGVFRCRGDNRHCALSVSSETEWQSFCQAAGHPEWATDSRFASLAERKRNEDELEKIVGEWTAQLSAEEVMDRLQKAGVKAGIAQDVNDLYRDPQLSYRKIFTTVMHPEIGPYEHTGAGFLLEKGELKFEPAPGFGEHNRQICTEILGMSEDQYEHLIASKALE